MLPHGWLMSDRLWQPSLVHNPPWKIHCHWVHWLHWLHWAHGVAAGQPSCCQGGLVTCTWLPQICSSFHLSICWKKGHYRRYNLDISLKNSTAARDG